MPTISSILVVCDGNHCRSPIGEVLLRDVLGAGMTVSSAGLTALEGFPAHAEVIRLMAQRGHDLTGHRGRQLTPELAIATDLILVMDLRQKEDCERLIPAVRGRVYLLGHWRPPAAKQIPDPFRRGADAFLKSLEQISQAIADWPPHLHRKQRSA